MNDRGASAVEYALLLAGIAVGLVLVIGGFNEVLAAVFDATCQAPGFDCNP
ncbi:MAG: Flp family type IVb pilin [Candidatus Nanopelagicales bacterium]